jgi:hypothetical protein
MTSSSTLERRNGTAVAFPVRTAEIALDEIGYTGWSATVRLNPRSSVYDQLVLFEEGAWWAAFGQIVLDWNFVDEQGEPLPLPRATGSEKELDLPVGVMTFLFTRYLEAVRVAAEVPKGPDGSSSATSRTSDESQKRG